MGLLTFAGRIVLVVLNIIFVIVSLALIIGGFILRFAFEVFDLEKVFNQVNSASNSLYGEEVDTSKFDFGAMASGFAIAMITLGVLMLALSFLGCCSACYNFTTVILVYAIILIVILLVQIAVVVVALAAPDQFKTLIRTKVKENLDDYEGLRGTSFTSVGVNFVSRQYQCCGADNYTDFVDKGTWKGNTGKPDGADVLTPVVCCKDLPATDSEKDNCAGKDGFNDEAAIAPRSNMDKGCVDEIWTEVVVNKYNIYLTVFVICAITQIVLIVFAILVYKDRGITGGLI